MINLILLFYYCLCKPRKYFRIEQISLRVFMNCFKFFNLYFVPIFFVAKFLQILGEFSQQANWSAIGLITQKYNTSNTLEAFVYVFTLNVLFQAPDFCPIFMLRDLAKFRLHVNILMNILCKLKIIWTPSVIKVNSSW